MGLNIIAVDGLDCSGKEHITKLLEQELREKYTTAFNVSRIEFPTYDQTKLIDMLLSKEYADIIEDEFFDSSIYLTKTAAFMEDQFAKILDLYKHDKYSDKTNIYIFDRYYRSKKKHKRYVYGTGLGLSIVKNILLLHNYPYGVKSTKNKGTIFYFKIKRDD